MTYSYFFTTPFQYFNSHPHEEDDVTPFKVMLFMFGISTHILTKRMTYVHCNLRNEEIISTHILTKRMTAPSFTANCEYLFQLTSSRRGWLFEGMKYNSGKPFQLTSSRRGWPIPTVFPSVFLTFQLTSSRRGWHFPHVFLISWIIISTHILTKRMTSKAEKIFLSSVFQLTSSRRGWQRQRKTKPLGKHFNSHPHEEDDAHVVHLFRVDSISTHILTKRMTELDEEETKKETFQLTSSRRGWQSTNWFVANTKHFNSHPHEEDDEFACLL